MKHEYSVSARKLHKELRTGYSFCHWIRRRIKRREFEEGYDYITRMGMSTGGRPPRLFFLTKEAAEELTLFEQKEYGQADELREQRKSGRVSCLYGETSGILPTVRKIQDKIICLPNRPPVMIDRDIAEIYETETKRINQAVRRNPDRFPDDFCFQLTKDEVENLRSQFVTFQWLQDVKYPPHVFTREGANMLSAVLSTPTAIQRSVQIMRAFSAMEAAAQKSQPQALTVEQWQKSVEFRLSALETRLAV